MWRIPGLDGVNFTADERRYTLISADKGGFRAYFGVSMPVVNPSPGDHSMGSRQSCGPLVATCAGISGPNKPNHDDGEMAHI